eukprot:TRINITY_DN8159_c0_g2_i3.p1 TRINITY_DN8159_c0_g2~~TRINITY_DN8159_c0_g2_i3.p1  ORF type:complete len:262 (+),score=37.81 TRINITY_DN8159_c0_g2_i3:95-880(+)
MQSSKKSERQFNTSLNLLSPANHSTTQAVSETKRDSTTPSTQCTSKFRKITLKVEKKKMARCLNSDYEKGRPQWVSRASSRGSIVPRQLPKLTPKIMKEYVKGLGKPLNFADCELSRGVKQSVPRTTKAQKPINKCLVNVSCRSDNLQADCSSREKFSENTSVRASNGRFEEGSKKVEEKLITSASFSTEPEKSPEERKATSKSSIGDTRAKHPCNCGSDSKLRCCKRAANWIRTSHRGHYLPQKYKQAYFVLYRSNEHRI